MARQVKEDAGKKSVAKADLERVIREATRQKQLAGEYASAAGQFIKNQIEHHGLERTALTMLLRMKAMETERQQGVMRAFLDYCLKAGLFDQTELFDDTVRTLQSIIDHIQSNDRRNANTPDEAIEELAN
jgi:hypothetical protein